MVVFQIGNDNLKRDVKNCVTGRGPRHYSIFTIFKTFQKSEPKLLEKLQKTCHGPGPLHIRKHRYVLYRICRGPRPVTQCGKIHPSIPPAIHPSIITITKNQFLQRTIRFYWKSAIRFLLCDFSLLLLSRGGPRRVIVTCWKSANSTPSLWFFTPYLVAGRPATCFRHQNY